MLKSNPALKHTSFGQAPSHGFPLVAAAASVLAHAVVIAVVMNTQIRPPVLAVDDPIITVRLVPSPAPEDSLPVEPETTPDPAEPEPEPEPAAQSTIESELTDIADETVTDETVTDDPVTPAEPVIEENPFGAEALRARLLDQVRAPSAETGQDAGAELPWASSGERISGVPGVRGWISGYIGTVAPSTSTWKENDGSSRGRYVLADGTVVCTRKRAPTIDEMMNPWKSIAVTMGSICGRQRPTPVDYSNPGIQPAPVAGSR